MSEKKLTKKAKNKVIIIAVAVVFVIALVATLIGNSDKLYEMFGIEPTPDLSENTIEVHYLDVGQGDCEIIVSGEDIMLIDAGEKEYAETVITYIETLGFDTIDYVIATHPHSDHIGAMSEVIDAFTVENIIMPKLVKRNTPTTACYEDMLKSIQSSGATVYAAYPEDTYSFGEAEITILAPFVQSDELNNMSVVCKTTYGETSFLFTGDCEAKVEKQILQHNYDISADVLKVGHHGSSTSSSKEFIEAINPKYAVISCATDNSYGHPHSEVLSLFDEMEIEVLRTDKIGNIIIKSDGVNIKVEK
jgi:beta-lactamase superfamily II metal-dependent hydrolase